MQAGSSISGGGGGIGAVLSDAARRRVHALMPAHVEGDDPPHVATANWVTSNVAVVIGALFFFITLTATAALLIFCRKKNAVFALPQQTTAEAGDGDYELDDISCRGSSSSDSSDNEDNNVAADAARAISCSSSSDFECDCDGRGHICERHNDNERNTFIRKHKQRHGSSKQSRNKHRNRKHHRKKQPKQQLETSSNTFNALCSMTNDSTSHRY